MKNLHLDFETYCELDLQKVGVHRYVEHRSFEPLCAAFELDGTAPCTLSFEYGVSKQHIMMLAAHLMSPEVQARAWNAAFETAVLRVLGITLANPILCTMQRALAYGLPAKLERAGPALGLSIGKDMIGHRLMLKMSKPQKDGTRYSATAEEWLGLLTYCKRDVEAERAIGEVIPELSEAERALSRIDARMNVRGVGVDLGRVRTLRRVARQAEAEEAAECTHLTAGAVNSPGTQTARLLKWLQDEGLAITDVSRAAIEEQLVHTGSSRLIGPVEEVLKIRQRAARGSVAKLGRMLEMGAGGRLQGQFQFLGASRTGRWAGRGVQMQNLPRVPAGFSPDMFCAMAKVTRGHWGLDAIAPAPLLDCVSWSLRSCLQAGDRQAMWGFDFSQIEARVLAWLAGQSDVLEVFRSGVDVYSWAAGQFRSQNRQFGKVLILALGFGMGATKLRDTARKIYLVTMTAAEAESVKREWRQRNSKIVDFWYAMEHAARSAILQRDRVFAVEGSELTLTCTERTLQMRLPSGRVLYYHKPHVDRGGVLTYWGEEMGQWVQRRTWGGTLAENATQAVARDVMAEAMMRAWTRMKAVPLMTVHDELVYATRSDKKRQEATKGDTGKIELLKNLMLEAPAWAGGLPIAGEAKLMTRYGVKMV